MSKKLLSIILVLVMIVSMFVTGCGNAEEQEQTEDVQNEVVDNKENEAPAKVDEEITTLQILTAGDEPADLDKVEAAINEKLVADGLAININVTYFPWSDYQDKSATMIMSNEDVDLYLTFQATAFNNYANGLSLDMAELYETYGKDIQPHIGEQDLNAFVTNEGALVAVPAIYPKDGIAGTILYREDLRVKYGLEPIVDEETLLAYCDAIVANEEGMYPFVKLSSALPRLFNGKFDNYTGDQDGRFYVIEKTADGKYVAHSKFEKGLEVHTTAQWNAEFQSKGYMPSDANQIDTETLNNWFKNGKTAIVNQDFYQFTQVENATKQNVEGAELAWVMLYPENPVGWGASNNCTSIASTCEAPEKAMQFLNWLHADQANYDLYIWGIEGEHYNLAEDGSIELPEGVTTENNPYNATPWNFYNVALHRTSAAECQNTKNAIAYFSTIKTIEAVAPDFTFDPTNVSLEVGQIQAVTDEVMKPMIDGATDISGWDAGLERLEDAGMSDYIAEVQRQLDEYYGQ